MMTKDEMGRAVVAHRNLIRSTVWQTLSACNFAGGGSVADDVVSDATLALLDGKLERYDASRGGSLATFIYTCVRNFTLDAMRTTHHTDEYDTNETGYDANERPLHVAVSELQSPEEFAMRQDTRKALSVLTSDEQADLATFLAPGFDEERYAAQHGVNVNATRARKCRALGKVTKLLKA